MSRDPIAVAPTDNLQQVARILSNNEISGAPVVDDHNRLLGVISRTDIVDWLLAGGRNIPASEVFQQFADEFAAPETNEPGAVEQLGSVREVMSPHAVTGSPDDFLADAARRMAEHRIHRVIVVNPDNTVIGVVTSFDVLKHFPTPHDPAGLPFRSEDQQRPRAERNSSASSTNPTRQKP